jgi:hypothetical protein
MELAITVAQPATVRYDLLQVARVPGAQACPADLNVDGFVDGGDLGILLNAWGACETPCDPDLNHDGFVDGVDLGALLGNWGTCP